MSTRARDAAREKQRSRANLSHSFCVDFRFRGYSRAIYAPTYRSCFTHASWVFRRESVAFSDTGIRISHRQCIIRFT